MTRAPLSFLLACIACVMLAEAIPASNPAWARGILGTGALVYGVLSLTVWFSPKR